MIAMLLGVAIFIWAGYWAIWACTTSPNIAVDYASQIEHMARDAQETGENGWQDIERAIQIRADLEMVFPDERRPAEFDFRQHLELATLNREQAIRWGVIRDDQSFGEMQAFAIEALNWLEANGVWDAIREAGEKPNIVYPFPPNVPMFSINLPFVPLRELARNRTASMDLAILNNDIPAAQRALQDVFTLARSMHAQPLLLPYLVGAAIHSLPMGHILRTARQGIASPEMIAALLEVIQQNPPPNNLAMAFEGERRFVLDVIQRHFSDDGDGDGILLYALMAPNMQNPIIGTPGGPPLHPIANVIGLAYPSRKAFTDAANTYYDFFVKEAAKPPSLRLGNAQTIRHQYEALGWRYTPLTMMLTDHSTVLRGQDAIMARYQGAKIILAIERYRIVQGALPDALDQLAPEFLSHVPLDPINNLPFVYKQLTNDPDGRDYILYSIGFDGIDNGGAITGTTQASTLLELANESGTDIVINMPLDE